MPNVVDVLKNQRENSIRKPGIQCGIVNVCTWSDSHSSMRKKKLKSLCFSSSSIMMLPLHTAFEPT